VTTLFDVAHRTASHLGAVLTGTATGGSTTTLIDTLRLDNYRDGYFDEGTVYVTYDAGGAAAAPQGEWGIIQEFNGNTQTVTFSNTLTAAIAAGDAYKLTSARFPLHQIIDAINRALDETGDVETVDSSNTAAAAQTEYTLPAANITVTKVEFNTRVGDADDLALQEITGWSVRKTAPGSADTLVLDAQPVVGRTLYITYTGKHPNRYTNSGVIDDRLDVAALSLRAAIILCEDKVFEADADSQIKGQLDVLRERYALAQALQAPGPRRRKRLFTSHLNKRVVTDDLRWPG